MIGARIATERCTSIRNPVNAAGLLFWIPAAGFYYCVLVFGSLKSLVEASSAP